MTPLQGKNNTATPRCVARYSVSFVDFSGGGSRLHRKQAIAHCHKVLVHVSGEVSQPALERISAMYSDVHMVSGVCDGWSRATFFPEGVWEGTFGSTYGSHRQGPILYPLEPYLVFSGGRSAHTRVTIYGAQRHAKISRAGFQLSLREAIPNLGDLATPPKS